MTEKLLLVLVVVIIVLSILVVYSVMTYNEREALYKRTLSQYSELDDCNGFVHNPCPYYVFDKKLDYIIEMLEGKK